MNGVYSDRDQVAGHGFASAHMQGSRKGRGSEPERGQGAVAAGLMAYILTREGVAAYSSHHRPSCCVQEEKYYLPFIAIAITGAAAPI